MAQLVLTDASIKINAVDLSDHVKSMTLNYEADALDATAMGATTKARLGGLKDWNCDVEFYQDFAAAKVDATIFPLVGTVVAFEFIPVKSTGVSATNPRYTGNVLVQSYPPGQGAVGDVQMAPVKLVASSALTRAIT